ncbi:DUF362 domain-containing protein [Chloroflexota bacterium]
MKKSLVSIVKGPKRPNQKEIEANVRKVIELTGGLADIISAGDTVIIKPNVVHAMHPDTGVTTDPRVCKSIADIIKEIGARPVIAESSSIGKDTEESFKVTGYTKLRDEGYEVIDLKKEETVIVQVPEGKVFKEISLPRIVVDAKTIISVPSMKTHMAVKVTLSLKNMKGILPDTFKRKFHLTFGIFHGVADLCTVMRPKLSIVDGIIAQEGLGPVEGRTPLELGLIIAGKDPVAVDTVTSLVMGFEPGEYEIANTAAESNIGTADINEIEVAGESISGIMRKFKRADEALKELIAIPDGFQLIFAEKACTSCRNSVLMSLIRLRKLDLLHKTIGWTVVAGKVDELPLVDKARLLLVGKCTSRFKNYGIHIDGCPPNTVNIAGGILGKKPTDELTLEWRWMD